MRGRVGSIGRGALAALVLAALVGFSSCDLFSTDVAVGWDASPGAVVARATFCCGFVPEIMVHNALPEATLWGDGRMVWTERGEQARRVLQGQVPAEAMRAWLARAVRVGFFGWQDLYEDPGIADLAPQCLAVTLSDRSKQVCEYYRGAPQAFHTLYDRLVSLAGGGTPFVPQQGYLIARAFPEDATPENPEDIDLVWPDDASASLADAAEGIWIEGALLALAWEAVNASPWGNVVRDGDRYYAIAVQIPGLSMNGPSAP